MWRNGTFLAVLGWSPSIDPSPTPKSRGRKNPLYFSPIEKQHDWSVLDSMSELDDLRDKVDRLERQLDALECALGVWPTLPGPFKGRWVPCDFCGQTIGHRSIPASCERATDGQGNPIRSKDGTPLIRSRFKECGMAMPGIAANCGDAVPGTADSYYQCESCALATSPPLIVRPGLVTGATRR